VQTQLGLALTAQNRHAAARLALREALALAPNYTDARIGLVRIALSQKELGGATRELAAVLDRNPDNAEAKALWLEIANAELTLRVDEARRLRGAGRFAEAEAIYRRLLKDRPRDADLLVAAGLVTAF
jgi:tetratricopeptide (TPR) repeat protein